MMYSETIRGSVYKPKQQIAEELHISKSTVYARMKEIEQEISRGRYEEGSIISDGNIVLVNMLVFLDYLNYRKFLREKNARKQVPPFRPEKWVRIQGWNDRIKVLEGSE